MKADRWRRITWLYRPALECEGNQRISFFAKDSTADEALRREGEALLPRPEQAKASIEEPTREIEVKAQASSQSQADIASLALAAGVMLDERYLIKKELGRGGVGLVFLARDQKLHSMPVVIKVLREHLIESEHKAWFEHKFRQEIAALALMDHPGVVRALDVGQLPDGRTYLVMQYVPGENVRSAMPPQGMELGRVAKLIHQMGQALTAAHEQGVIHRDLKPENIMLQQAGEEEYVKLIDFGIATVREAPTPTSIKSTKVVGTIDYMAPEQLQGKPSVASDIYALGVIAYEMVTGRRPFNPDSPHQLLELQRAGVRVKPCDLRPGLPETAQAAILKALSFAPQERYTRARDFSEALVLALEGKAGPSARLESAPNPLWFILSALFLPLTFALAAVTSRRFLGDAPDIAGVLATLSLGLLCLFVGSTFTQRGQQYIERSLSRCGVKRKFQGKWRTVFTFAVLLIVSAFYFSLPAIARIYNNRRGVQFQQAGDLPAAIKSYARAVSLDPNYAVAHYNLASACEDVLEFEKALAEYQAALRADPKFYFAYNNLARLYLVHRKDCGSALKILNAALELRPQEPHIRYTLYKNRGWAHFGLGFHDLAGEDLREALKWRGDGAAAHCLLAQALEAQQKQNAAMEEWETCVAYAPGEGDVEATWLSLAQERLRQAGKK